MPAPAISAKDVFDDALEIASLVEREAYLDRACAEAPEIRQKVEALLRAYDEAGSQFLKGPEIPSNLTSPYQAPIETPGVEPKTVNDLQGAVQPKLSQSQEEQIGPYKLLNKLGEGGMGSVYLAQQEKPMRRQVALKIIRPGMNSARILARFDAERQALAMMEHDSIARVFDAGTTPSGQPYFVMEHIPGVTLDRYCRDNALTIRERLFLFSAICQAVQHAHQKGVIHRDLKPSNILVALIDGKPVPKIIDFGLAKAVEQPLTDHEDMTQAGNILGTWKYMSPEQANADEKGIDTRTDIYSLGVVLYELLTGTVPIDLAGQKGGYSELQRRIRDEVPARPSDRLTTSGERLARAAAERKSDAATLPKLLRSELDWITLKALEKDRERRYQTARDFANDVQAYLNDEPVQACPPSRRYRLGKFVRRNKLVVGSGSVVFTALVVAAVSLTVSLVQTREAKANETAAKDQAVKDRDKAQEARQREHKALNITWGGIHTQVRQRAKLGEVEKTTFQNMLTGLQELANTEPDSSEQERAIAAETAFHVGSLNELIDKKADAESYYRKAIELYNSLVADFPKDLYRSELARCNYDLAVSLNDLGKPTDAETAYRRSIELLEQLTTDFPQIPAYRSDLADAYNNLAVMLRDAKKLKDAEKIYRDAVFLAEKVKAESPEKRWYQIKLAATYGNLGNVIRDQGKPNESLDSYFNATALLKPICFEIGTEEERKVAGEYLRNVCWDRANARGQLGLHEDAVRDWDSALKLNAGAMPQEERIRQFLETSKSEVMLKQNSSPTPAILFQIVIANAQASSVAKACGDEENLFQYYTRRTLELLKQAKTAGYFGNAQSIKQFQEAPAFHELLKMDEFKSFLDSLAIETKTQDKIEKK